MSGTTIAYGDRPITRDNGFATFEFLQFLERLNRAANGLNNSGAGLQTQIDANAAGIDNLEGQISTLSSQVTHAQATADGAQAYASALGNRRPTEAVLDVSGAVALTSATAIEVLQAPVNAGLHVLIGMVCLTGGGLLSFARASVSTATATIETAPGAFATGWFGAGVSPVTLGVDLTIGSFMRVVNIVHVASVPTTAFLNVDASFSGSISAYGSLIIWPLGA